MAPSRKRKSDEMADPATPEVSGTPAPKKMRITQTQKQALIDNLQLEITERARRLRAHYALQCADLKSRIERRVNRIPVSMRSMTMTELMEQHNPKPVPIQKQPAKATATIKTQASQPAARTTRKRKSSIVIAADPPQDQNGSNEDSISTTQPVAAPKSNLRATKRGGSRTGRGGGGGVLSPRSHNSRTLPRSPIKGDTKSGDCQPALPSPSKPHQAATTSIARPLSPLKPHSPLKTAAMATTSAISSSVHNILSTAKSTATRANAKTARPVGNQLTRAVSQASNHSATSNTTATSTGTVVKSSNARTVRGRAAGAAAAAKKTAAAAIGAGKDKPKPATTTKTTKTGAAKKVVGTGTTKRAAATTTVAADPVPATGRRILRKRN